MKALKLLPSITGNGGAPMAPMAPSFGIPFLRMIYQRSAVPDLPGVPVSMVAAFDLNDILFKWQAQCRRLEKLPLQTGDGARKSSKAMKLCRSLPYIWKMIL